MRRNLASGTTSFMRNTLPNQSFQQTAAAPLNETRSNASE
jgi:hypothetical protein